MFTIDKQGACHANRHLSDTPDVFDIARHYLRVIGKLFGVIQFDAGFFFDKLLALRNYLGAIVIVIAARNSLIVTHVLRSLALAAWYSSVSFAT